MPLSRYFRFRLRTLLVVVAILSPLLAWTSYSLNWIRERRAALSGKERYHLLTVHDPPRTKAPGLLWIFGEEGVPTLPPQRFGYTEAQMRHLMELFPEARRSFGSVTYVDGDAD